MGRTELEWGVLPSWLAGWRADWLTGWVADGLHFGWLLPSVDGVCVSVCVCMYMCFRLTPALHSCGVAWLAAGARFVLAGIPLALGSSASHCVFLYWCQGVLSTRLYADQSYLLGVLVGVLGTTRAANAALLAWFLRGAMRDPAFLQYARRSYAVLGLVSALSLLRLKALPALRCGAFGLEGLSAPLPGRAARRLVVFRWRQTLSLTLLHICTPTPLIQEYKNTRKKIRVRTDDHSSMLAIIKEGSHAF